MSLSAIELARLAADCLDIAQRGAALALTGFGHRPTISVKSRNDLVTDYDVASQRLCIELLEARHPGVPIIAEEAARSKLDAAKAPLVFCIDPIDGTTNFAQGHPFWCVSIGVLAKGKPVGGAVVAPSLSMSWHGFVHASRAELVKNGEPRRVSETASLAQAVLATGFPPVRDRAPENNFDSFIAVKKAARAVRRCGSAAIDLCFVADGTYDGYWERRLHLWDCAAGGAFVLAGGGRITSLDGGEPHYEAGHIVATNGHFHDELVRVIGA
ncbi:MAG: inositol monophosphatase [Polyangiaceae bacterium]|nr:inositol monophosphatase [Polyangiaceae bacterium]